MGIFLAYLLTDLNRDAMHAMRSMEIGLYTHSFSFPFSFCLYVCMYYTMLSTIYHGWEGRNEMKFGNKDYFGLDLN